MAWCCSNAFSRRAGSVFSIFFGVLAGALAGGAAATRPARATMAARVNRERLDRRMGDLRMAVMVPGKLPHPNGGHNTYPDFRTGP
jgi:hypothetical protein